MIHPCQIQLRTFREKFKYERAKKTLDIPPANLSLGEQRRRYFDEAVRQGVEDVSMQDYLRSLKHAVFKTSREIDLRRTCDFILLLHFSSYAYTRMLYDIIIII